MDKKLQARGETGGCRSLDFAINRRLTLALATPLML
ncbi:MAG: hypothetical protein JWQ69_2998 [Pseudomonas sp.]|nr:hypothetical protein [Pseudomonas sp.]